MKWTPEKIEALCRRYPHEDNARLARELGCSRKALVFRASTLGLRKTDAANEARYAAMSRRATPDSIPGTRREIATGTVIVRGNILTHLSNCSASREAAPQENEREDGCQSDPPFKQRGAGGMGLDGSRPGGMAAGTILAVDSEKGDITPHINCPHCHMPITAPAFFRSTFSHSQEA